MITTVLKLFVFLLLHPVQVLMYVLLHLLLQVQELLQSFAKMVFQLVHPDKLMFAQVAHSHVVLVFHLVKQAVELE